MTKIYGYISCQMPSGSQLVTVIDDQGYIITYFEAYTYSLAKKFCQNDHAKARYNQQYGNYKWDFEWVDKPYQHQGLITAQQNYEQIYGTSFRGHVRDERQY